MIDPDDEDALSPETMAKWGITPEDLEFRSDDPALHTKFDPSLVPTLDLLGPRIIDAGMTELKNRIDGEISIFDIYDRFMPSGKVRPHPHAGQRESIKFSCPDPTHRDSNPSAWTNDDGLWYCGACDAKGDKYTVAALGEGLDVRRDFREVCIRIANAFGIDYRPSRGPEVRFIDPPEPLALPPGPPPDIKVKELDDLWATPPALPYLDPHKLFPVGTFMRAYMDATAHDDTAHEFHMFPGFIATGMAMGRDCWLRDDPDVFGNLYICTYAESGAGKTRSHGPFREVVLQALPYDPDADPASKGAKWIHNPGSPEFLVDEFSKAITDPVTNKIVGYASVRGIILINEFSTFMAKGDRSGGLKGQITSMFDDHRAAIGSRGKISNAEGIFCSILTSTQPAAIADILKRTDLLSGFSNRFIYPKGTYKELQAFRNSYFNPDKPVELLRELRAWAGSGRIIDLDGGGRALFEEFFHDQIVPLKKADFPMLVRMDLIIKKIILLLAANEHTIWANAELVSRAISFYNYLRFTWDTLTGNVITGGDEEVLAWIQDYIREYWKATAGTFPGQNELARKIPRRYTKEGVRKGLNTLESLGIVHKVEYRPAPGAAGRPTTRWHLTDLD